MRVLDAADVAHATPWDELMRSLAEGLAQGSVEAPGRTVYPLPGPTGAQAALLLMPAWSQVTAGDGLIGVKVVNFVPDNGDRGLPTIHAVYLVFDRVTGETVALLDGEAITARRTAALAALSTQYLARPSARRLLVMGTGALAAPIIEAHLATTSITDVAIWGRTPDRAAAIAEQINTSAVEVVDTLDAAVAQADVVVCATAATAPILHGAALAAGAHVCLLGAFRGDMRESDDDVIRGAAVFVDVLPGALDSGDLAAPIHAGWFRAEMVRGDLAAVAAGRVGRNDPEEITVFKSVGFAAADLLAAHVALRQR